MWKYDTYVAWLLSRQRGSLAAQGFDAYRRSAPKMSFQAK
jgi:hypothetical protein